MSWGREGALRISAGQAAEWGRFKLVGVTALGVRYAIEM